MSTCPLLHVIQLTPPGRGAVATLLVAGRRAVEAVAAHFRAAGGRALGQTPADRLVFGHFGPEPGEEVVVRRREDGSVEVNCHGGLAAVAMIRDALVAEGCRAIDWRDWVRQAGKDPIAADAQSALADARTLRTAAILLDQYQGALSREIDAICRDLARGAAAARGRLDALLARADLGRHLTQPWRVVLAGQPNAGKSSLLNALLGYGRAIVHDAPGTTRDVLTATTAMEGWPVELADTAGLGDADEEIERAGIEQALQELADANLVLLVVDTTRPWSEAAAVLPAVQADALVVHSKCDLAPAAGPECSAGVHTSTVTGEGIAELIEAIAHRLVSAPPPPGAAVPFTGGQVAELEAAREAIDQDDLQAAAMRLGALLGRAPSLSD
jgi:tRNA modification GTPase